ncbi:restriction endonuclease subunit S, partial [Gemella sp. zg-1178]|uniref:restriction endonuclease subunit S n=1 Tax=Gemella sp. zg-1178 TaxID=2840372 RepID=UPI001C048FA4
IDFEFMDAYISELEEERISELAAYLTVSGLDNYKLSTLEREALDLVLADKLTWAEFRIGDLFEKLNLKFKKAKFNKETDVSKIKTAEFNIPLVNAKYGDNGIMYYGRSSDFESAGMTIDIINDGAISTGSVYPQPQRTGVLYNAYLIKPFFEVNNHILYFLSSSIEKSIKEKFGYENKAGWEKVKKEFIQLPTKNGQIDFEFINTLVSAVQKLVIKDVVLYADKKIQATKEVVKRK